jgi:NTP pyrophosphatase (non-canonical NTP hydrolase)
MSHSTNLTLNMMGASGVGTITQEETNHDASIVRTKIITPNTCQLNQGEKAMTQDSLLTKEESMELDEYQYLAHRTANYRHEMYPMMLLHEEAGELSSQFTKVKLRGDDKHIDVAAAKKELGDCLWSIAEIATQLGFKLSDVAKTNIDKLAGRQRRGTLLGDGDDR